MPPALALESTRLQHDLCAIRRSSGHLCWLAWIAIYEFGSVAGDRIPSIPSADSPHTGPLAPTPRPVDSLNHLHRVLHGGVLHLLENYRSGNTRTCNQSD